MALERIVISGYYGCGNLGDEAILTALLARLRARWPRLEPLVLSGAPQETTRLHDVRAINRRSLPAIARELRAAQLLISGGGGLLQDRTSRRSPLYYLGIIALAQWLDRPVFFIGQGVGPLRRRWLQTLAQRRLRRVAYALVRDEASLRLLRNWGLPQELLAQAGDLALLWPDAGAGKTLSPLAEAPGEKPYAIAALKGPLAECQAELIAPELDRLAAEQGLQIILLALAAREDCPATALVAGQMQQPSLQLAPQPGELAETLELIRGARCLLGMRLHSLIFALLAGTPCAALSEDPKLERFLAQVERASGLQLPCRSPGQLRRPGNRLAGSLARLACERGEISAALQRGATKLVAQTEAALEQCFERMS